MTGPPDDRAPLAIGMQWASRVMAIAGVMVVPGLGGYWIDQRLGTKAVFTITGFAFGMSAGMWQLIRLTAKDEQDSSDRQRPGGPESS